MVHHAVLRERARRRVRNRHALDRPQQRVLQLERVHLGNAGVHVLAKLQGHVDRHARSDPVPVVEGLVFLLVALPAKRNVRQVRVLVAAHVVHDEAVVLVLAAQQPRRRRERDALRVRAVAGLQGEVGRLGQQLGVDIARCGLPRQAEDHDLGGAGLSVPGVLDLHVVQRHAVALQVQQVAAPVA